MTDEELIESLRSFAGGKLLYTNTPNHLRLSAADRIEELVKERDRFEAALARCCLVGGTTYFFERVEAAEAKLAKAVEVLREIETDCDADYPPSHGAIKYAIRTALAELEKRND